MNNAQIAAYNAGFDYGERAAMLVAFGGNRCGPPHFDTALEESEFWKGYDAGYESVED